MGVDTVNEELYGIQGGCAGYGICESCVVDYVNFMVDFQGCSDGGDKLMGGLIGGLEDIMGEYGDSTDDISGDTDDDTFDDDDLFGDLLGGMMESGPLSAIGLMCSYEETKSYCETCELTFEYGDDGEKTGNYSLQMNCPNAPEESPGETTGGLEDLEYYCTQFQMCGTCNFDPDNFVIDVRDCNSTSFWESAFGAAGDAYSTDSSDSSEEEEPDTPATEEPIETDPVEEEEPDTPATEDPIETDPVEEEEPDTPATEEVTETDPVVEEAVGNLESGSYSFSPKLTSSASLVLLTLATASFAQMLLS